MIRCVAVSLLFLFASSSSWGQTQSWDTIPRLPQHYNEKLAQFRKQKVSTGKTLFLGNSITEMGDFRKLLGDSTIVNRGIGGDITFGVIARIDEVTRFKPSKLFLLIGINDLSKGIPEDVVAENVFMIISKIKTASPKTQVFVQSILPVNPSFKNFPKGYDLMEPVGTVNKLVSNPQMQKRFGYTFVDLYKEFTDKEGFLNATMSVDGLHLNPAGYKHWIKILKDGKHL